MREILPFIPDQLFVLVIVVLGLGLMTGLISRRKAAAAIGLVFLTLLSRPFIRAFVSMLPIWLLLPALLVFGLFIMRRIATLLLGRGAGDDMIGSLAADGVRFILRILCYPFVFLWRQARRQY